MDQLASTITDAATGGKVLTIQPGGNHGDSLIYLGFDEIAKQKGIRTVPFGNNRFRNDRPPSLPSSKITTYPKWLLHHVRYSKFRLIDDISAIYIHGGGNFNDIWKGGISCFKTVARHFDCPIIVGPQSCRFRDTNPESLFASVENKVHFFCREEYSYNIIQDSVSNQNHVSVYLSDDTALFLDLDDLPVEELTSEYQLIAMRTDEESASPLIQQNINSPIRVADVSVTERTFEDWIAAVAKASHIYTDRLHVAILATILQKPVTWYEIGYHKSRGVYEYSLSDYKQLEFKRKGK